MAPVVGSVFTIQRSMAHEFVDGNRARFDDPTGHEVIEGNDRVLWVSEGNDVTTALRHCIPPMVRFEDPGMRLLRGV